MKPTTKLFLVLLTVLASCNYFDKKNSGQDSFPQSIQLENLDKTNVFNALFKPEVFEWCIWKPTEADSLFPVSDDGYCHTKLEDILYYRYNDIDNALLILATYELADGEPSSCHPCAPYVSIAIFSKNASNKWVIQKYEKDFGVHGSYGELSPFELETFGNQMFLQEAWIYSSMGYTKQGITYYCLPSLIKSLSISSEDESMSDKAENEQENSSEELQDISAGNETKVLITKKGQKYEEGQGMIQINESMEYILNDSCIFRPSKK